MPTFRRFDEIEAWQKARELTGAVKDSAAEVLSHAYVALDQGFISKHDFDYLFAKISELGRMIAALMSYLRKSGTKGLKFKAV